MDEFLKSLSFKKGRAAWSFFWGMIFLSLLSYAWPQNTEEWLFVNATDSAYFFEKIRSGQIGKIIGRSFVHADVFHCLSCVFWLLLVGVQIEALYGSILLVFLIFTIGSVSNCVEYWIRGSIPCGFSAVAVGLGAFLYRCQFLFQEKIYFPKLEKIILLGHPFGALIVSLGLYYHVSNAIFLPLDQFIQLIGPSCLNVAHFAHFSGMAMGWFLGGFIRRSARIA